MESTRSVEEITSELGRYRTMADYYKEHPGRKKANEVDLAVIAGRLMNLSGIGLPEELEKSRSELFDFFYNSYNFCD